MSLPNANGNITVQKAENKLHYFEEEKNSFDKCVSCDEQMGVTVTKLDHSMDLANGDANSNVSATYFGVHIPNESLEICEPFANVFTDKLEAMKALKKHKKARFKVFSRREDAAEFVMHGVVQNMSVQEVAPGQMVGEKPMIFKGPKSQDLVRLRKLIECDALETVQTMIWENPRYLISSGDTPSILQEGSRYNALHVATKAKSAKMTELIILTIGEPKFARLLYGDDNMESCEQRARILLDLYLNTPDKGLNETPLHFAVKFGAKEAVEVLVACPQCDRNSKNKFGQTPKDIICSRDNNATEKLRQEISMFLDDQFYVPVLRSEDNSVQATIGLPFSPVRPLVLNTGLMDARVQIQAFAGPMNEQQAVVFRKKWKTPPRSNPNSPTSWSRRMQDPEKGLEIAGRNLAAEFGCDWKEYWPFIDTFTDLTTAEGLGKLETFFKRKFVEKADKSSLMHKQDVSPLYRHEEKDLTIQTQLSIEPLSPISDLCYSLEACSLLDRSQEAYKKLGVKNIPVKSLGFRSQLEEEALLNMITNPGLSPFLCIEKSCHVYAKRIADGLQHLTVIGEPTSDLLKQEVKHLQTLICSYMDDPRFVSVDFHLVHSRIASIVNDQLRGLPSEEFDLISRLCAEVTANSPSTYYCSSDEEELNTHTETYRRQANTNKMSNKDASMFSDHIKCIIKHIRNGFNRGQEPVNHESPILTEEDCMQVWSDAEKCNCRWQTQCFLRNSRKGSSYKRLKHATNLKTLDNGGNVEIDDVARRLNYEPYLDSSERGKVQAKLNGDVDNIKWDMKEISDSENEDDFFTPPTSLKGGDSSQDEGMSSAEEDEEVFIEGREATSMDLAVLHAIKDCYISASDYPHVYRWRHMMLLRPAEERVNWSSRARYRPTMCMPQKAEARLQQTESWHRVVNPRSPASPQFEDKRFNYNRVPFNF